MDQSTETYWADESPEKFAELLFSRMNTSSSAYGAQTGIQDLLLRAHQAFYGALSWSPDSGPSSSVVRASGDQGQSLEFKVNIARTNASAKHQIVTNPTLTWTATPVNTDSQSLADAERGSQILEYLWKQNGYQGQAISSTLGAVISGESFLLTLWDEQAGKPMDYVDGRLRYSGDLAVYSVASWDVYRDPGATSFSASEWLCARVRKSKWALVAQFPDQRQQILAQAQQAPGSVFTPAYQGPVTPAADDDSTWVYYFFHRRCPQLPLGLQAVLLGPDCVLAHEPLEDCYSDPLPIHRIAESDVLNTPWAYSSFWDSLAIQALFDDIHSSIGTNIHSFGRQLISAESDSNLPVDQLADGPLVVYRAKGTQPPVPLQLTAQPASAFQHLQTLEQEMRQVMGLNDFVVGQPQSSEMNAQYAALMTSLAIQQNSDFQKRYVAFVSNFGRSMLKIFRSKASVPRKIAITGVHGPGPTQDFSGEDLKNLDDVYVSIGSALAQSTAGRVSLAQMFTAQGFVQTPEQLQEVVESGSLKPLTQGLQAELLYVAEENEQLLKGESPPVKITDSHQLHIREHRATTFSAQARANPDVNIATDAHIKAHLDMLLNTDPRILAIMGQAAPPPEAAPGPGSPPAPVQAQAEAALQDPMQSQQPQVADIKAPEPPPDPATGQPLVPKQ